MSAGKEPLLNAYDPIWSNLAITIRKVDGKDSLISLFSEGLFLLFEELLSNSMKQDVAAFFSVLSADLLFKWINNHPIDESLEKLRLESRAMAANDIISKKFPEDFLDMLLSIYIKGGEDIFQKSIEKSLANLKDNTDDNENLQIVLMDHSIKATLSCPLDAEVYSNLCMRLLSKFKTNK